MAPRRWCVRNSDPGQTSKGAPLVQSEESTARRRPLLCRQRPALAQNRSGHPGKAARGIGEGIDGRATSHGPAQNPGRKGGARRTRREMVGGNFTSKGVADVCSLPCAPSCAPGHPPPPSARRTRLASPVVKSGARSSHWRGKSHAKPSARVKSSGRRALNSSIRKPSGTAPCASASCHRASPHRRQNIAAATLLL